MENGTYEQIVTHPEKELELNGLEAPHELQMNTVSQQPKNTNADILKPTCHHCKKQDITKPVSLVEKRTRNKLKLLKTILETKTAAPITVTQTATPKK